jgi:hypothetical protein
MVVLHMKFSYLICFNLLSLAPARNKSIYPFFNQFDFYIAHLDTDDVLKLEIILFVILY